MKKKTFIKSPIFYMGNKYKLLDRLIENFPTEGINQFIDLFGGSGVVSANVDYPHIYYNELNPHIYNLFGVLSSTEPQTVINHVLSRINLFDIYNKTTDTLQIEDVEIRKEASKKYNNFRSHYNKQQNKDWLDLFTLTFFSFSNLIRFNKNGDFNMPFGNRCFLPIDHGNTLNSFYNHFKGKEVKTYNKDAFELLDTVLKALDENTLEKDIFVYLDPPYSNTTAVYNEKRANGGWTIEHDLKLFKKLDQLTKHNIKWALSNVLVHKGKHNDHLEDWAIKNNYNIIDFKEVKYSALGKGNAKTREVLITNYEKINTT